MRSVRVEAALLKIIDASPGALVITDGDGVIVVANRAAEALFGYDRGELLGQRVEVLIPERFRPEHPAQRDGFFGHPDARPMGAGRDLHGLRKDGTEVPIEIGLNPLETNDGLLVLTGIVDLSERKALERELQSKVEELRRADRQKNEFLAMLSHELRNPLAPMRNALLILNARGADETARSTARGMLERQLHHLIRLVDDLMDVSRIISGRIELRRELIDVNSAVLRGIEIAQPMIEARGHTLVTRLSESPLQLEADLVRLSQVVSNLLTNAARYSPNAGRIWVETEFIDGFASIAVRDEGAGIGPELLPHVFDLFVQGDSGMARTLGGLGVGLTLVKRLVAMHGGTVSAASGGAGLGSEFVVRLPHARPMDQSCGSSAAPRVTDALGRRVLVVDDNVDAAESIATLLRLSGYTVSVVHDGRSAIDAVPRDKPDVIVLDIGLPDIDGYAVAKRLKATPEYQRIPLIAVTGYGQQEDRQRSRDAGIDVHLTKPVDPAMLETFVATA